MLPFPRSLVCLVMFAGLLACGKKKTDDTASVDAKIRSTGSSLTLTQLAAGLATHYPTASALLSSDPTTTSVFTIESYTVPVSRITLAQNLSGSGYGSGSDIYQCPETTDDGCRVDLSKKIDVDNLLAGPGKKDVTPGTFDGIAVEFCGEHSSLNAGGTANSYFDVKFKGSVTLGTTLYYTNATSGLSTSAPSQEVTMRLKGAGCGVTTKLIQPITLAQGDSLTVTLYADPNGSLLATDAASSYNNIACAGSDPTSICAQPVAVYGTNDAATPTIERYSMTFTDSDSTTYSKGLMTVLFNSAGQAFGATVVNAFDNTMSKRALHGNFNFMNVATNADGSLTFQAYASDNVTPTNVIANLKRVGTSTGTISLFVDKTLNWSATKL